MTDKPSPGKKWLILLLVKYRYVLLVASIAALFLSYFPASRLKLNRSIESLYSEKDPHLQDYRKSKQLFGGDEFVIVAWQDPDLQNEIDPQDFEDDLEAEEGSEAGDDIFGDEEFENLRNPMEHIREFSEQLSQIPGVDATSTRNFANMLSPKEVPVFFRLMLSKKRDELIELSRGMLIGDDNVTTAVVLRLEPESETETNRTETFRLIRKAAEDHEFKTFVVGEPVQINDMFDYVEDDGETLFYFCLGILAIVLLYLFKRIRWILLPILIVIASVQGTRALWALSGLQLTMVSSMLNSLVTIIGIATVMHVTIHYRELRKTHERVNSLIRTFNDLAHPVFWTCLTTAVGFLALLSSDITPVRSFGLMIATGTFFVLAGTFFILPGGILLGKIQINPGQAKVEDKLILFLHSITRGVKNHPGFIKASMGVLGLIGLTGLFKLQIETDFSKNFRESSPIVQSLNFVEQNLGGAGTWEVNFPAPEILTEEYIDKVRSLGEKLRQNPNLTKVIVISDLMDLTPKPTFAEDPVRGVLDRIGEYQPDYEPTFYSPEENRMRIVFRARERQSSSEKLKLISDVTALTRKEFPESRVTGLFVLLAYLIESLLKDQLVSFAIAAGGIFLLMSFAFHSFRIGFVSIIPNLFPILVVIGGLGWLNIPVNIGTAMIASVSMGLTIDASIHFIAGFQRALSQGMNVDDAMMATHQEVGRALLIASFSLVVGFSVLSLSHFIPLVYFGVLVSLSIIGGLVGNLFLLPVFLKQIYQEKPYVPGN